MGVGGTYGHGKNAKKFGGGRQNGRGGQNKKSVSVRGVQLARWGGAPKVVVSRKSYYLCYMKIKFKEISPSMQGLKVEGGRLVNDMGGGQANVGVMGITRAAELRKQMKMAQKEAMMTRAYVNAERISQSFETGEM